MNAKDQVAIITGGARGIGEAAAEKLACLGMKTVIFDINLEAAHHVASRLKTNGSESLAIQADVIKRKEVPKEHIQALARNIPFRRLGEPSEVADAIAFLCSEKSKYITGQVLSVSGGLTMAG